MQITDFQTLTDLLYMRVASHATVMHATVELYRPKTMFLRYVFTLCYVRLKFHLIVYTRLCYNLNAPIVRRLVNMTINLDDVEFIGNDLSRPECVVAHNSGTLFVPDWTEAGGISVIHPDGRCVRVLQKNSSFAIKPNGVALEPDGACLLAHLGDTEGGIYRLTADGTLSPEVLSVNGSSMPPTNYVVRDRQQRLWITVSTRLTPRSDDYRASANSGFIALAEPGTTDARIVADNLGYTNECVVDEANGLVYVNETFVRRLTRFNLHADGSLSNRQVIATFDTGTYPDGLALAADGNLWITSIVSNRVLIVQPDGQTQVILEDSVDEHIDETEVAYRKNSLGRIHLDQARSRILKNISNLAFGGPDLKTIYLGNLLGDRIPFFKSTVAGAPLPHWDVPLGAWSSV